MTSPTRRVLLAARPDARAPFQAALGDQVDFLTADTVEEAKTLIASNEHIHLVCSTLYFDESRMFDLLVWIRANRRDLPVICARVLPKDVVPFSLDAVAVAAKGMGAAAFVDYPNLVSEHGAEGARAALEAVMACHLAM